MIGTMMTKSSRPNHVKSPGRDHFPLNSYGAEVRRSFITTGRFPGHTTRAPPVGFELEINDFQFYAIANLDKTSFILSF